MVPTKDLKERPTILTVQLTTLDLLLIILTQKF